MTEQSASQQSWQRRAAIAVMLLFGIVLTLHAELSRFNLDEHGDMAENYAWGVLWQWGYFKHPPFFGWATAAWFSIFPHVDWLYYVFASLNAVIAIYLLWRIAARYGNADVQLFVVLCAILIPPFSFQAIKYNANAAMTPVWAGVFLFYLRGIEARRLLDALVLGILVGISMLTKYHSAVLVGALFMHALYDRQARPILFSAFGLVVAVSSIVVFAGHVWWLFDNDFRPITYASEQGDGLLSDFLYSVVLFLAGMLVYLLPALVLALIMRSPRDGYPFLWLARWRGLGATTEGRALLAFAFLPTVLTLVLAYLSSAEMNLVWVLPLFLPLVIMVALLLPDELLRRNMRRALIVTGLYFVALVVSAPIYKESIRGGVKQHLTVPAAQVSASLDAYWDQYGGGRSGPVIAGDPFLANSMSFYSRHQALALEDNSLDFAKGYMSAAEIAERGMIIICPADDGACGELAKTLASGRADAVTVPFTITGFDGKRQWPYVVTILKPL